MDRRVAGASEQEIAEALFLAPEGCLEVDVDLNIAIHCPASGPVRSTISGLAHPRAPVLRPGRPAPQDWSSDAPT